MSAKSVMVLMRISLSIVLGFPAERGVRYRFSFLAAGWLRDSAAAAASFFVHEPSLDSHLDSHGYVSNFSCA